MPIAIALPLFWAISWSWYTFFFSLSDEYVICLGCKSPDTILSKENRLFFLRCEKVNFYELLLASFVLIFCMPFVPSCPAHLRKGISKNGFLLTVCFIHGSILMKFHSICGQWFWEFHVMMFKDYYRPTSQLTNCSFLS